MPWLSKNLSFPFSVTREEDADADYFEECDTRRLQRACGCGLVDFASVLQRLRQTSARLDEKLIQAALARNHPR